MVRRKKTLLPVLMLFSLLLAMTNFCLAMLLYPIAVKAAAPATPSHLGCGEVPDSPIAKNKLSTAKTGSSLLPCCIGQNQSNDTAIFNAEQPLLLSVSEQASSDDQISENFSLRGYAADLWPPPEQKIIDSTIIRI